MCSKLINHYKCNNEHKEERRKGRRRGGNVWSFDNLYTIHFDNGQNIHINSENYEESGYMHDLDLQIISH